jgi:hypothetical protein|uniref:Tail assembly chaperone protein n=1 Tax=Myoviridae sp. ct5xZ3 TaxID=2827601 RepID=A0A8S5RS49_9CAUD|nr:MAG TPA: tail assembly chaperone protein [Myoviridae sp. ct5xZ3]
MALKQMSPTKETIGNMNFYITPFGAFKAANLTGELANVLAPLLGVIAPFVNDKSGKGLMDTDIDTKQVGEAMSNCSTISGDKVETLMQKLLLGGHIVVEYNDESGKKQSDELDMDLANEIFCGEVQDMFILCFYVIRLNFNGFFKKFAGLSGAEKSAAPQTMRPIL